MKAILFALCALVLASGAASANTPDPNQSIVDHVIISSWNNVPAANGLTACTPSDAGFDVFVKDVAGNPVANSDVRIVFGGTGTSIRPYRLQQGSQIEIRCFDHSFRGLTDGAGRLSFVPHFGRWAETNVVPVYADGIQIALIQARSPDYDNDGDVDLSDLSTFATDYTDTQYHGRSDFDDCPATKLGDFAFFANQYLASTAAGVPIDTCP